jgi:DNA topoisomerase I
MTRLEQLQQHGIRREGSPKKGFTYLREDDKEVKGEELKRIKALKIPPAWTEVFINASPRGTLQAIGKDTKGRWQYLYHSNHTKRQEQKKFERIKKFAEALPRMRKIVKRGLSKRGLGRERVLASILRILSTCFIRPGSQVYADENGSYGIATLRRKHVTIEGDLIRFDFTGKHGKRQIRELRDAKVARVVKQLLELPGYEVFKYIDDEGKIVDIRRRHINQYIKEVMGEEFTAKDFRTWAGTLICACELAKAGAEVEESKSARKRKVVEAIKETAKHLGNTPAICRSSYIYPGLFNSFEKGRVVKDYFEMVEDLVEQRSNGLHPAEKALLELLEDRVEAVV